MDRPFSANSPYSTTPTERLSSYRDRVTEPDREPRSASHSGSYSAVPTISDYDDIHHDPVDYPDFGDYDDAEDYHDDAPETDAYEFDDEGEFTGYDEEAIDRRWMWIAGVAGVILLVAIICTGVILGGGDSGSVSATIASPPSTTAAPEPTASAAPAAPTLPKETVTTLTPSATAMPAPVPVEAAPPAAPDPRTITYTVTGNRQLIDLVTVIYTDQQGALQTDVNVALPWSRTVVLDPGVELSSVTATSVGGQLNCTIADAAGAPIVAQANNAMIATCTK